MNLITLDFETYWDKDFTLSKLTPLQYVLGEQFEIISCAVKLNAEPTRVVFGRGEVERLLDDLQANEQALLAHNMSGFDAYICAYVLGLKPKMWMCTMAMARPIHAKTTGLGLAKLVEHYGIGHKNAAILHSTRGKHLADFTQGELDAMATYNADDTDQCYELFQRLKPHYTTKELWQIDAVTRMRVEPKFVVDTAMLDVAASMERDRKRKRVLSLAKHMRTSGLGSGAVAQATTVEDLEEAVRADLASAPKFAALLESLQVELPMKPSPTTEGKMVPALAKSDEAFLALQEHDNEIVAAAASARLAVKSTLTETRIEKFQIAAGLTGGLLPIPVKFCGADTTGRDSGEEYNPQNLPRINPSAPKPSDALRNCIKAPPGHKIIVADLSGIELRVNHFLWNSPAVELFKADPEADLYKDFASARYGVPVTDVTKDQRQMGKVAHLGLGFGAGPPTFRRFAKVQYNLEIAEGESVVVVEEWREKYKPIVDGWKACGHALADIMRGNSRPVDPWDLVWTCSEGLRLPSGRLIRYPDLRVEDDGTWPDGRPKRSFVYASGRHKARITGPKADENIVQALARDVIFDDTFDFFKLTRLRPQLRVHDELVYVVPESEADDLLAALQGILRTPPKWWPQLVVWSEGDSALSYGAAK